MTVIYVGPTAVYELGQVGELELLESYDGDLRIPGPVHDEITVEPATTNVERFLAETAVNTDVAEEYLEAARDLLGEEATPATASVVAGVLAHREPTDRTAVAVVSDDHRLRRLVEGLSASVTSSFGTVVRATVDDKYLKPDQAKRIVRRMDQHGLHTTGEIRERTVGAL